MIPYIEWISFQVGPLTIYIWGLMVALGFLFGTWVAARRAKKLELSSRVIYDFAFWMMFAGLIGGRLGYVLFYDLQTFLLSPERIFYVWEGGASVFGGFILCVIVGIWFLKKRGLPVWNYADVAVFGLPFGLWIGRIGCFFIHDHPGTVTDFFLGVRYPDNLIRHDHGLYLSLTGLFIAIVFLWISRKDQPVGTYLVLFSLLYGSIRFFLDFTRVTDVTYLGMTPAQYFSIVLVALGVGLLIRLRRINKI